MLPRVLNKKDLRACVEALMAQRTVVGPVAKEDKFVFAQTSIVI